MSGEHPRHRLDPLLQSSIRLSIVVALAEVAEAEAKLVAETVEISLATMSNHMTALAEAKYLSIRKGYVGKRPRTWVLLTPYGRERLAVHLAALREIAGLSSTSEMT